MNWEQEVYKSLVKVWYRNREDGMIEMRGKVDTHDTGRFIRIVNNRQTLIIPLDVVREIKIEHET